MLMVPPQALVLHRGIVFDLVALMMMEMRKVMMTLAMGMRTINTGQEGPVYRQGPVHGQGPHMRTRTAIRGHEEGQREGQGHTGGLGQKGCQGRMKGQGHAESHGQVQALRELFFQ
jgi:hypothetical protein